MHRQDFRVLLLYHLCSLCSLPLEESQVPGGGLAGRGHPDVLRAPSCRGTEQGKATLPAICILQGWKGPSSPSMPPRGSAISQYGFAPEEHLTENSVTFAYTQGSYFSVDSQGYGFCTVSLYNPPSTLNPENLP